MTHHEHKEGEEQQDEQEEIKDLDVAEEQLDDVSGGATSRRMGDEKRAR